MSLKFANKKKLALYVFLACISACGNVVIAYVTKIMLNSAQYHRGSLKQLILIAALGAALLIVIMFLNFAYRYLRSDITRDINLKLKEKTITYLVAQQNDSQKDGLNLMTNDLKQIESLKITNELMIISEIAAFAISIFVGLINSWLLTIIFVIATIIPGFIQKFFITDIQNKSAIWEKQNAEYTQATVDAINGSKTAMLYDAQIPVISYVIKQAKQMENALRALNYTQGAISTLIITIADIFSFIIPFLVGAILMFNGQIGAGTLVMIVQLSNDFINPITMIFDQLNQIRSTKPIWDKVKQALNFKESKATSEPSLTFNELEVKDLAYSINNKKVLNNVSFKVKAGEKVLLMAPSGFGKTTLLKLLAGQLTPSAGSITIDQNNLTGNWLKSHDYFGYINQKPFMFDRSLLFNLTLGKKYSEAELQNAIKLAGLYELVNEKGLDYQIGQNGNNLSGGQIQRIEIARSILAKRPILLADEATSALDNELSLQIHQVLLKNSNFAVIEVAHKISHQEKEMFDRIIDLSK
ncbi:ABC transporter ATP-binding protein [Lactobacillus paragasseri]|uniref:ATP-binding cassette domain-containing protein n=2 Tax=Lactobacillus paragasseri TaxID=2107999 RepID=UPI0012E1D952|nr:ABC transporter ATP-binding protein [Lactobacillus paragasseri]MDK8085763.1 ABC transporter ATP-binding protein [Lactobacillus paragasseri]MDX5117702.1 ABC transporter ATP-binding protein [Lactobacillus paragasseri]MDX5121583.1 ABC transporter ATP-binding protein [Lactobacillus paragasseri]QGT97666.1 ABC transporter ATP-binding protein [Lactobacillus paragasseri]UWI46881.1 ABC transporter ATP-binding protein [Lactobacillus paragasseri]